jgi:Galactosyltransferase
MAQQILIKNKMMVRQNMQENISGSNYKVIVGIISCSKNIDKIAAIRATWVKDLEKYNIPYYFIIGDPSINDYKIVGDILYVPCADSYESLLQKVCCFYKYVVGHTAYDHVYKVDDDCFVNAELLYATGFWNFNYFGRIVCSDERELNRNWHFGKCNTSVHNNTPYAGEYYGAWCGGGYGYFLSRLAMEQLISTAFTTVDLYEDKAIGDALRMKNILPETNAAYIALDILELNTENSRRSVFIDFVIQCADLIFRAVVITEVRQNYQFLQIRNKKHRIQQAND